MTVSAIVALVIQLLPVILNAAGVITPSIETLIQQLGASIPGLITSLAQGKGPTADVLAVLQALQPEIAALRLNTGLDAMDLQMADTLDGGITDALTAWQRASTVCDPSTLTPLPTEL